MHLFTYKTKGFTNIFEKISHFKVFFFFLYTVIIEIPMKNNSFW